MSSRVLDRSEGGGWSRRQFAVSCGAALALGSWLHRAAFSQTKGADQGSADELLTPRARRAVDNGLKFLVEKQNDDGSFGAGDYSRNGAVCGLCGMTFLAQGSTPDRGRFAATVRRCLEFLLANVSASGLVQAGDHSGREPMYGHGFATLFLAEVHGTSSHAVRDPLARAVQLILRSQNNEGGWRYEPRPYEADVSVTVCQVMALRAARNAGVFVPNEAIDRAVEYLKRAQNPDGGFLYMLNHPGESSFPRSAAAVVALMSAGLYGGDEVRRGIDYVQQHAPAAKSLSGTSYFLYGHYYAAQAMWQVGGQDWRAWYTSIRDFLISQQNRDGSWYEAISPEYSTAMACLILQMPENYLPIFQR